MSQNTQKSHKRQLSAADSTAPRPTKVHRTRDASPATRAAADLAARLVISTKVQYMDEDDGKELSGPSAPPPSVPLATPAPISQLPVQPSQPTPISILLPGVGNASRPSVRAPPPVLAKASRAVPTGPVYPSNRRHNNGFRAPRQMLMAGNGATGKTTLIHPRFWRKVGLPPARLDDGGLVCSVFTGSVSASADLINPEQTSYVRKYRCDQLIEEAAADALGLLAIRYSNARHKERLFDDAAWTADGIVSYSAFRSVPEITPFNKSTTTMEWDAFPIVQELVFGMHSIMQVDENYLLQAYAHCAVLPSEKDEFVEILDFGAGSFSNGPIWVFTNSENQSQVKLVISPPRRRGSRLTCSCMSGDVLTAFTVPQSSYHFFVKPFRIGEGPSSHFELNISFSIFGRRNKREKLGKPKKLSRKYLPAVQ